MNEREKQIINDIMDDLNRALKIANMSNDEYIEFYNEDCYGFPIDSSTVFASKFGVTKTTLELVRMRIEMLERGC